MPGGPKTQNKHKRHKAFREPQNVKTGMTKHRCFSIFQLLQYCSHWFGNVCAIFLQLVHQKNRMQKRQNLNATQMQLEGNLNALANVLELHWCSTLILEKHGSVEFCLSSQRLQAALSFTEVFEKISWDYKVYIYVYIYIGVIFGDIMG